MTASMTVIPGHSVRWVLSYSRAQAQNDFSCKHMSSGSLHFRLVLLMFCCVAWANTPAADTVALCEADLQPRIEVVFQDREVATYNMNSVADLNRMAGNRRAE